MFPISKASSPSSISVVLCSQECHSGGVWSPSKLSKKYVVLAVLLSMDDFNWIFIVSIPKTMYAHTVQTSHRPYYIAAKRFPSLRIDWVGCISELLHRKTAFYQMLIFCRLDRILLSAERNRVAIWMIQFMRLDDVCYIEVYIGYTATLFKYFEDSWKN